MSSDSSDEQPPRGTPAGINRRDFFRFSALLSAVPVLVSRMQAAVAAPLARLRLGSPILTESVLLDLLPIKGASADALKSVQSEIEKVTILRTIYNKRMASPDEAAEITVPGSVWDQIGRVTNNALSILEEQRRDLEPVFREVDNAEVQVKRFF
jgi:hypothetical protein